MARANTISAVKPYSWKIIAGTLCGTLLALA